MQKTPIRTCVATRQRHPDSVLLRMVVDPQDIKRIIPDPQRQLPGRGAWITPDLGALELAEKRRAIPRALKVPVDADTSEVHIYLEALAASEVLGTERTDEKEDRTLMSTR